MPKLSKVEKNESKDLSPGSPSQTELAEQTRPYVEGALSDKGAEKPTGILGVLEKRLGQQPDHYKRPGGVTFPEVKAALEKNPALMQSLSKMEETGGAPDVIAIEGDTFVFADCSAESPIGRRNLDYRQSVEMAKGMAVDMLSETDYRAMQKKGKFDLDSLSWLDSEDIIDTRGARFGGRFDYGVDVDRCDADDLYLFPSGGWRASLRVPRTKNQK